MRFGLDSKDDELGSRELMLIGGALSAQLRYVSRLAKNNKDEEARGRNLVNELELRVLLEKLEGVKQCVMT